MAYLNISQEKLEALRSEYKHRNGRGKYPRQKMLPEYKSIYPWVLPDEVDPYFAFCTICECRLSAKRSDLGKHEGSIKHTENAARKCMEGGVAIKKRRQLVMQDLSHYARRESEEDASFDMDGDDDIPYIKQEPIINIVENCSAVDNLDELNEPSSADTYVTDSDKEDSDEAAASAEEEISYATPAKRLSVEPDSLPMQVTINEANTIQSYSIREISPAAVFATPTQTTNYGSSTGSLQYPPQRMASVPTPQAPCKITIKKITAPMTTATISQVSSTATITPVPASISVPPNITPSCIGTMAQQAPQPHSNGTSHVTRDSFELFFDSICASVKALPPKLATEGKIRVMQLVGELEIRAITEREQEAARVTAATTGQQNATVASTTK